MLTDKPQMFMLGSDMYKDSMEKIYLDMNVIVDCLRGKDPLTVSIINKKKSNESIFPYSPAHMEEVAVILKTEKDFHKAKGYIEKHLSYISTLSDNWEYLPSVDNGIILKNEEPNTCFERVIDFYGLTEFAEDNEKFLQCFRDEKSFSEYLGNNWDNWDTDELPLFDNIQKKHHIDKKQINNIPPELLFQNANIRSALDAKIVMHGYSFNSLPKYSDIKKKHGEIELLISLLYNFLETIGYRTEKRGKSRSRMHDVTHGIYATSADLFVIGDKRYRKKTMAIYSLLEIPTKVISTDTFRKHMA